MKISLLITKKVFKSLLFLCILILAVVISKPSSVYSQSGCITDAVNNQINSAMTADNNGGVIVTWQDFRNGKYEIFAQRMTFAGTEMWANNGISICSQDSNVNPVIVNDGAGGAIIMWQSYRGSADGDIYAQHINSNGTMQWAADGIPLCQVVFDQNTLSIVSDNNGGAILTWLDYRSNNGFADIYAQRVTSAGAMLWTPNGVSVCNQAGAQLGPKLISDASGGAFITWYDLRAGNYDIYTQRLGPDGAALWTANGAATCTIGTDQMKPDICTDGVDGVIITWYDFRSTTDFNIYAQRQGPLGNTLWVVDGIVLNNNVAYAQIDPKIVSDDLGGAIISWTDYRTSVNSDIYAQHVNAAGAVLWTATGVTICTSVNDQILSQIASNGSNGAYITWEDHRDPANSDIYVQKISSAAALTWSADGGAICSQAFDQEKPILVADGSFGTYVVWQDYRSGTSFDIYGLGFDTALPVELSSFTSTIHGKNIELKWSTVSEINNSGFDVERKSLQNSWAKIGNVAGAGNSNNVSNYLFEDRDLAQGSYNYRLKQIDLNGNYEYFNLLNEVLIGLPGKFSLNQNYPNPFNPTTKIVYDLPFSSRVSLRVFDSGGREIAQLVNEMQSAGSYSVNFNGSGLSSGIYFYTINSEGANQSFAKTMKMVLVK